VRRTSKRLAAIALLLLACARTHVDRAQWQRMSPGEKTLYVRSLLGHERAKESKGGAPVRHMRPAEEYVRDIDAAYVRGESRDVDAVFAAAR
jgi:predicted Fe-S protein YdhL (DUF1289 family)